LIFILLGTLFKVYILILFPCMKNISLLFSMIRTVISQNCTGI